MQQSPSASSASSSFYLSTEPYFLNISGFTFFIALHDNSRLLAISCLFPLPTPGTVELPFALHTAPPEMEACHLAYIDFLPLPKIKYILIRSNGLVDDESCRLYLTSSSIRIARGNQSWGSSGWVLSEKLTEGWANFLNDWLKWEETGLFYSMSF